MRYRNSNRSLRSYEELKVGDEFPQAVYELTPLLISEYEKAVETLPSSTDLVPPLAIITYAMKALYQFIYIPPGSIHGSQEVEFFTPVTIGSRINYQIRIVQKLTRAKLDILAVEFNAFKYRKLVASGKMTLVLND